MAASSSSTRKPSYGSAGMMASANTVGLASDRSPLQKLELELKRINDDEATDELIFRRLTQRDGGGSTRYGPRKRQAEEPHGNDGALNDYSVQAAPEEKEKGRGNRIGQFVHEHNPFHLHHNAPPSRIMSPYAGLKRLATQKVARLTLEDMKLDDAKSHWDPQNKPAFYQNLWRDSLDETADSTLDPSGGSSPVVELLDSKTEKSVDTPHHRRRHDPENPSLRHHPDHMSAPHTKEERDDTLILTYLRAIPARKIPDRKQFSPPLTIRCGPLLRYTGLRRDASDSKEERETWRGSIMIVTIDETSNYSPSPSIRIFRVDPATGVPSGGTSGRKKKKNSTRSSSRSKNKSQTAENMRKYKVVDGFKLHCQSGHSFWRFNIEVELVDSEAKIAYQINRGPASYFWVPAKGQPMNIMFHTCNGFSLGINPADFSGVNPLWDDVLAKHQQKPFHVMIGGGDQVYNDAVAKQTKHFQAWVNIKNPFHKAAAEFTSELANELEEFYFERYCFWFAQGSFGVANSQIPMVNIWDDHDIIDGYGSYPNHFNRCPVFTGLGAVAFKYYMLFQHQSTLDEDEQHEPSWLLGSGPGPYIAERSRSVFMFLGRAVAFLGIDCRTERMKDLVLAPRTYENIFARLKNEIVPGETKHLLVLCGVPMAYPRLVWLENLLTSRIMDPIKALARMGIFNHFINNFDGGVEVLDDLDDHWTAKSHKIERNHFIQRLQRIAADLSVRITILSGDVHLAGIGQFMSNPKLNLPKIRDYRYMANIISSAIVNSPPPNTLADVLNKRNKVHHLDGDTDEDMFPIFRRDVDDTARNNKRMMPRRNYCTITMFDMQNPSSASLALEPSRNSTFRRKKRLTAQESGRSANSLPRNAKLDGVSDSREAMSLPGLMKDSLHVTLRVEIDQRDPRRGTKPYRFLIPILSYAQEPGILGKKNTPSKDKNTVRSI